jgi:hypothetical protein
MSNYEEDFYEDDDQPQESNPVRARMKQLEKENREIRKALAEAEQAKREATFLKAGINPSEAKFKYFVKGYDGDLNPDAIIAAAEEAQLIAPSKPQVDEEEKRGWQQTNKVAAGNESAPPPASWAKRIQDASSQEEVYQIFAEAREQGIEFD